MLGGEDRAQGSRLSTTRLCHAGRRSCRTRRCPSRSRRSGLMGVGTKPCTIHEESPDTFEPQYVTVASSSSAHVAAARGVAAVVERGAALDGQQHALVTWETRVGRARRLRVPSSPPKVLAPAPHSLLSSNRHHARCPARSPRGTTERVRPLAGEQGGAGQIPEASEAASGEASSPPSAGIDGGVTVNGGGRRIERIGSVERLGPARPRPRTPRPASVDGAGRAEPGRERRARRAHVGARALVRPPHASPRSRVGSSRRGLRAAAAFARILSTVARKRRGEAGDWGRGPGRARARTVRRKQHEPAGRPTRPSWEPRCVPPPRAGMASGRRPRVRRHGVRALAGCKDEGGCDPNEPCVCSGGNVIATGCTGDGCLQDCHNVGNACAGRPGNDHCTSLCYDTNACTSSCGKRTATSPANKLVVVALSAALVAATTARASRAVSAGAGSTIRCNSVSVVRRRVPPDVLRLARTSRSATSNASAAARPPRARTARSRADHADGPPGPDDAALGVAGAWATLPDQRRGAGAVHDSRPGRSRAVSRGAGATPRARSVGALRARYGWGYGLGLRASFEIVHHGFVGSINDSAGRHTGVGADFGHYDGDGTVVPGTCRRFVPGPNGTSVRRGPGEEQQRFSYWFLPVVMQWNSWSTRWWVRVRRAGALAYVSDAPRFSSGIWFYLVEGAIGSRKQRRSRCGSGIRRSASACRFSGELRIEAYW